MSRTPSHGASRRRWHPGPQQHGGHGRARRLHHQPVPAGHAAHAAHAQGQLRPHQRLQLHHRRVGLHLRLRGACRLSAKTFKDYIEAARKSPGAVNYGSTGIGTSPHLLLEELATAAGVQLNHVPFKGNADQMQALLGGHVMAASDATGWDKFVDEGRMRLLVTFSDARTARWPDVPTAKDLGYNVVSQSPYGLVGPRGMDPAVVTRLHDAFKQAMDSPEHAELMKQLNQAVWYRNGADYRAWAVETFAKDKALIERLGLAAK